MFDSVAVTTARWVDALRAAELAANDAWLRQGDALLALWDALVPSFGARMVPADAHLLAEAATALGLHEQAVQHRLAEAVQLRCHPQVRARLVDGSWSVAHARVALTELGALHDPDGPVGDPDGEQAEHDLADRVAVAVMSRRGPGGERERLTPPQLRTEIRREGVRLDPACAARRRRRAAARDVGMRLKRRHDGLAELSLYAPALYAPAVQASAMRSLVDGLAAPSGPQDDRSAGQRHVDAVLGALVARAGTGVAVELELLLGPGGGAPVGPPSVGAVEPVRVRAGLDPALADALGRTQAPAAPAPATSPAPLGVVPDLDGEPTDPELPVELVGADRLPLGLSRVTLRRLLTDPHGQVVAADSTARPLPDHPRAARPLPDHPLAVHPLDRPLPVPPAPTGRHDPTSAQSAVLAARDRTCRFPGCRARAARTDGDHRTPWPLGATDLPNLQLLCRRHHRLKHDGWQPARAPDGTTTWTSPTGQTHPRGPD